MGDTKSKSKGAAGKPAGKAKDLPGGAAGGARMQPEAKGQKPKGAPASSSGGAKGKSGNRG